MQNLPGQKDHLFVIVEIVQENDTSVSLISQLLFTIINKINMRMNKISMSSEITEHEIRVLLIP